jgi:hypothetical protein
MATFYDELLDARNTFKENHQFLECIQDLFVKNDENFRKEVKRMKEQLLMQAKTSLCKISVNYTMSIEPVFTTLDWDWIPVYIPDTYNKTTKKVVIFNERMGCFADTTQHNSAIRYICNNVPKLNAWLAILREMFNKSTIECSMTNNEGKTDCQFVITVSYTFKD